MRRYGTEVVLDAVAIQLMKVTELQQKRQVDATTRTTATFQYNCTKRVPIPAIGIVFTGQTTTDEDSIPNDGNYDDDNCNCPTITTDV